MIGHEEFGTGRRRVVVLNDWLCDTSTWDGARAYLDADRFTWSFADLRGYGRSRGLTGDFTLEEAAADVIELADTLGWPTFAIVGHSMSTLVALQLSQHWPGRVERTVVLTPPPPTSFGADEAAVEGLRAVALGSDETSSRFVQSALGSWSAGWATFKAKRWRDTADPQAVAGYVTMFASLGLPDLTTRISCRVLAVTGEKDLEVLRQTAISPALQSLCDDLLVVPIADSGHYPMQETPPLLVGIIERFLGEQPAHSAAS